MSAFYEIIARYYDAEVGEKVDDLRLYSELAEQYGSPIFDLGCGTGRVLLHLAQEAHRVHGIDDSKEMLKRLQNKLDALPHLKEYVTYAQADALTYEDVTRYKLVLLTYNALMHFHTEEKQIQLLQRMHTLLADDGLMVIDLPNAGETFATQETDAVLLDRRFMEPETGNLVMVFSNSYLDRVKQDLQVEWIYDEIHDDGTVKRLVAPHLLRYFFYPELKYLLEKVGFAVEAVYGSTDEDPFEDGSERMIVYARKALGS